MLKKVNAPLAAPTASNEAISGRGRKTYGEVDRRPRALRFLVQLCHLRFLVEFCLADFYGANEVPPVFSRGPLGLTPLCDCRGLFL